MSETAADALGAPEPAAAPPVAPPAALAADPAVVVPVPAPAIEVPAAGEVPVPASWLDGTEEGERALATEKGWKGPSDVIRQYGSLEKLMGAPRERLLTLPEDPTVEGSMDEVWNRLGRPAKAEDYDVPDLDEDSGLKIMPALKELAHKHGIPQTALAAVLEGVAGIAQSGEQELDQNAANERAAMLETDKKALESEWGGAENFAKGNQAATRGMALIQKILPGVDMKAIRDLPGVGYKGIMGLTRWVGEGNQETAGDGNEIVTPGTFENSSAWAQEQIATQYKPGQPLFDAHANGETWATEKVAKLHELAASDPNWRRG